MGKSGSIHVIYGEEPREMVKKLLSSAALEKKIRPGSLIGLKPNLVVAKPSSSGATTSPEITGAVIEYLKENSFDNIIMLEGSWIGDSTEKAFSVCGYRDLSEKYGVPLFDTKRDSFTVKKSGSYSMEISDKALEVDFLISMPVIKGHCQTGMTGALKNMKGCISDREKRKFHQQGLHDPIAHLNAIICPDFVIADGLCGDLDFEEGGNPVRMNRIFCADDPVLADSYIASLLGYMPQEIPYISASEKLGAGSMDIETAEIIELNKDRTIAVPPSSGRVKSLSGYIDQKNACSACYANLIHALARLEDSGRLSGFKGKISIGQGFRWKESERPGIGSCTSSFENYLPGCPPAPLDIMDFLKDEIER